MRGTTGSTAASGEGDSSTPVTKDWPTMQRERRRDVARQAGLLAETLVRAVRPTRAQLDETVVILRECEKWLLDATAELEVVNAGAEQR